MPVAGANTDTSQVSAAVERFLASRGAAPRAQNTAATVVDRFLESRKRTTPAANAPHTCSVCSTPEAAPEPAIETKPAPPAAPQPIPVDFVCEADVRLAVHRSTKINVSTKTIITPAAREMANQHDVLTTVPAPSSSTRPKESE